MKTLELCRSNSLGNRYHEPSVIELRTVSKEEAEALLAQNLPNGFFWREQEDFLKKIGHQAETRP